MNRVSTPSLPDDIPELKRLCATAFHTIAELEKQLFWLKRQAFGQKADIVPPTPLPEAQDLFASEPVKADAAPVPTETITYQRSKKGHGRRAFPEHLPRVEEVVEPTEADKTCVCCGQPKEKIGEDVCEVLEIVPQKLYVRRIVRPRYACRAHAEAGVVQAKPPARLIPKGNVGEGLLAQVLLEKYVNHQPLSRQEANFKRLRVSIPVSTMVSWMETATSKLSGIVASMRTRIITGEIAFSDDTPLPVLRKDKIGATHRGTMWVYSDGKETVVFEYTPGRGQVGPQEFLMNFTGYLHTDAYAVYGTLHVAGRVKPVFCWAHARRRFVTALQAGDERARRALQWISRLFKVDRYAREKQMDAVETQVLRSRISREIVERFEACLKAMETSVLPKSALGDAIGYYRRNREGFLTFLTHGGLSLDNNLSERQIRQVVIGRRNYFFCGSEEGARRAAILYSLVCSCKLMGIDPWKYLAHVFLVLANAPETVPDTLTPACLKNALA